RHDAAARAARPPIRSRDEPAARGPGPPRSSPPTQPGAENYGTGACGRRADCRRMGTDVTISPESMRIVPLLRTVPPLACTPTALAASKAQAAEPCVSRLTAA